MIAKSLKQLLTTIIVGTLFLCGTANAGETLYKLEKRTTLPSSDTWWDYVKMEPGGSRLFMARVADGLTVFDVDENKVVADVKNSIGANGPLILPEYGRAYVAMTDGTLLTVDLNTLEPIERSQLAIDGGLNSAIYDPATKRIHAITGTRKEISTYFSLDAKTGNLISKTTFPYRKMDDPATDGDGTLFAPVRYDDLILILDSKTLQEKDRWSVPCHPAKVKYQKKTQLLFIACIGENPLFLALNAKTGEEVARIPIGLGQDALIVDNQRGRIITSNGIDGTMTVIGQFGTNNFRYLGTVYTQIGARMMDIDKRTGHLYLVNADVTKSPGKSETDESITTYHDDSFVVMTYAPQ
ncbi:YncE family protein [Hyphococcus lacteus]|uniref:YncE family protein n=1 Tax=Hyphococcus lacteus TaxID=3143536 RepID=A0ABV3Z6V2_9PROT